MPAGISHIPFYEKQSISNKALFLAATAYALPLAALILWRPIVGVAFGIAPLLALMAAHGPFLIGLVLVAILLIQFSKGTSFFRPTYDIVLRAAASGELKPRAQVLMSGVQVGTVGGMRLAPDGRSVAITLRIYRHVQLHKDARFVIAQSSFLGDQHVAILPDANIIELSVRGRHVGTVQEGEIFARIGSIQGLTRCDSRPAAVHLQGSYGCDDDGAIGNQLAQP